MVIADVNFLAVIVSAVIAMAIGAFWYSPFGFGKQWSALMGWTSKKDTEDMKKGATQSYVWGFVAALVTAYVLAVVLGWAVATSVAEGLQVAFWVWLGFFATTQVGAMLWDRKPFKLFAINTGFNLVALLVQGALLAIWV